MPIALNNPNRGRIKAAEVAVEKSLVKSSAHKRQLKLALLEIRHLVLGLNNQSMTIKKQLLPQAKKLLVETEKGFRKGRYTVLQWIDAQTELFTIERTMNDVHAQIFQQYLELERITGQSFNGNSNTSLGEQQ